MKRRGKSTSAEHARLLHGPYRRPLARHGASLFCELRGTVVSTTTDGLRLKVGPVAAFPLGQRQPKLGRKLLIEVPTSATIQTVKKWGAPGTPAALVDAQPGQPVDLWTTAAPATMKAERGDDMALNASLVSLLVR